MTNRNVSPLKKPLMLAASMAVMMVLAALIAASTASPAFAQQDEGGEEPGLLTKGRVAGKAFLDGLTGGDSPRENAEEEQEGSGEDGSTGGGSGQGGGGPGGEPGPGAEAGQGTDDTAGEYGVWTEPINIAQGLVFICAGIGLSAGILTVGTAGGSRERHQKGIEIIGNTLAGFILGTLAVQIYNVLGDVVVGF